jgi:hypothetical protein
LLALPYLSILLGFVGYPLEQMSHQELSDYFNEHILRELVTLRYALDRLTAGAAPAALWTCLYVAFTTSARNLYEFLNSIGTSREIRARDYVDSFRPSSISNIAGILQELNRQVFHMSKLRTAGLRDKVNLDDLKRLSLWIETNLVALSSVMPADIASAAHSEIAKLDAAGEFYTDTSKEAAPSTSIQDSIVTLSKFEL